MSLLKELNAGALKIKIYENRVQMGKEAAKDIAECIKKLQSEKDEINIIFAAAPSQNDTLAALIATDNIEWNKINAFHMDEYVGISKDAPQGFGNFLKNCLFDKVPFKSINYIYSETETPEETCIRYGNLITGKKIDIVCLGIGENAHIAFNDPWVADFNDNEIIKKVKLDNTCRNQQVNDGCFAKLEDVPEEALTLTIPVLYNADYLFCSVPAATKAEAVYATLHSNITEDVPATIMKKHKNAVMYCDKDSAAKII